MSGTSFTSHAFSDRGQAREGNEDAFYRGVTVFAVADGMGGHQAGEVASETAVAPLAEIDGREWPSAAEAEAALADAVRAANSDVVHQAAANPEWRGMGTTLTAVLVRDGRLHVAHVGDSRAYLFRPSDGLLQLTTDHTLVEQLVQDGRISRDEIATHPQRSVITRAIGVELDVEVDALAPLELQPGDQVLLCSDGLTGPVDDEEIARVLVEEPDGDQACETLIRAANRAGGPDNITVVLLRVFDRAKGDGGAGALAQAPPRIDTAELDPVTAPPPGVQRAVSAQGGARRGLRWPGGLALGPALGWALGVVVLVSTVGAGVYVVLSRSWFVGADGGEVVIFNGLPQQIGGMSLSRVYERTGLTVTELPSLRASRVEDGIDVRNREAALAQVELLRDAAEREQATEEPQASPFPSPPSRSPTAQPSPVEPPALGPTPTVQVPSA
jgi:protein phosphatase